MIIVEPGAKNYFNFLEYESTCNTQLSYVDNIFQVLKTVIEASQESDGGDNKEDAFWVNAMEAYILNVITLYMLA